MIKCLVKVYDVNSRRFKDYDVLKNREKDIKALKKKSRDKAEFALALRREFMWRYWSKCEWECIISRKDGGIVLSSWVGPSGAVQVGGEFWEAFADHFLEKRAEAKIDVYDQIMFGDRFDRLVDELWNTRLRWERL